jgi:urea carboxylase-associated protein 2
MTDDSIQSGELYRETLRGGSAWSRRLARHQVLRIVDTSGKACVSALFYNAKEPLERYNMADTLKAQFTAFLTKGRVLYSDMGRVLASIIDDTCGWHDTLSGCGDAGALRAKLGEGTYQKLRNDFYRNARDNFLVELSKHGLGKRDVVANVNFFVAVVVDDEGRMSWRPQNSRPAAYVDLRFEMDTLVVLTNTPHPLDPATIYGPPPVDLVIRQGKPASADDPCRLSRPENGRGFALTEAYATEQGR